jgi:hypothetical protein
MLNLQRFISFLHSGRSVKKNISIKLKQPPRPRGRPKKSDKAPPKPKKVEVIEEKENFGL